MLQAGNVTVVVVPTLPRLACTGPVQTLFLELSYCALP
jgi:hypothetical protein